MTLTPKSPEEVAETLACAAARGSQIVLGGAFSKNAMAGPLASAETAISTAGLNRVLEYEPRDLTISVEAGMKFRELSRILATNGQMVPLDPPFAETATVGGVLASDSSGPRRRLYGTARDMVIGLKFATVAGKLAQSGGMVVKNVAGLDMAKLMIGSFGTLAAIVSANFKLQPMPWCSRTFVLGFASVGDAIAQRNQILRGVLQPAAIDLLNGPAAARLGLDGVALLVQAGGNAAVIERYGRELAGAQPVEADGEQALWRQVQEFTPRFLAESPDSAVVRVSCLLTEMEPVMRSLDVPALARAANGVVYACFPECDAASGWMRRHERRAVIEFAPPEKKASLDLWPTPGNDLATMKRIKQLFDPGNLLNRGRLYGRI